MGKRVYFVAGEVFGRLTVVGESGQYYKDKWRLWETRCECGSTYLVTAKNLLRSRYTGRMISCGCYRRSEEHVRRRTAHLLSG